MVIGTEANPNELEKVTTNRKNMIESPKSEDSKALGKKIMKTIVQGRRLSLFFTKIGCFC